MPQQRFTYRTYNDQRSDYERELADSLFEIMGRRIHDPPGIADELNRTGPPPRGRTVWTVDIFMSEIERLGAYTNAVGGPVGSHGNNATSERIDG